MTSSLRHRNHRASSGGAVTLLAAYLMAAPPSLGAQMAQEAYERGEAMAESGNWRGALQQWASIREAYGTSGESDPRVGPAIMATAIENGAADWYEDGSRLYLWGFSGSNLADFREAVELEARRIVPLLHPLDSALWEPYFEGDTRSLALRVARFWLEHDPTPDTDLNERLVEHWTRIVEARERFRYNTSSIYDTDDRGIVYVKYGPPDNRARGHLGANEIELKIRVDDALAREVMRRFDPNPQFELWKYGGLTPDEFSFFLFGNVRGTGPFELVDGPLDLISDQARSLASAGNSPGQVRVQHYLELFYYRDLAILGGRYGRRFGELSDLWDGYTMRRNVFGNGGRPAPSAPTLESFSFRYHEEDKYHPPGVPDVPVRSEFEGEARAVEMVVQAVRVLDTSNQPMLVVQSLSAPRLKVGDVEKRRAYMSPVRDTRHTLILRNSDLEEAGRVAQDAPAATGGISVFHLLHPPQPIHLTVFAKPTGQRRLDADTLSLAGQGHAYVERPLSSDTSVFEVSDLSVGTPWNVPDGEESLLPFPLLPGNRVWTGDALRVYVELYHMRAGQDDLRRYSLSFRLLPLDERGNVKSSPQPVTLGIQLEADTPRAKRFFDIGLAGQEPGLYRLEVDATDVIAGETVTRVSQIEIIG